MDIHTPLRINWKIPVSLSGDFWGNIVDIERRVNPGLLDVAGLLAVLYTIGYLAMVGMLFFVAIPPTNREPLIQLFGLMSAIQMALIAYFFGASKSGDAAQKAAETKQVKSDEVIASIAATAASGTANGGIKQL